jgi:hypothetical protein
MKSPDEHLREALRSMSPEDLAEIDRQLADSDDATGHVEWLEDPDPFGRSWDWIERRRQAAGDGPRKRLAVTPPVVRPIRSRSRGYLWASGVAASIFVLAAGAWSLFGTREAIREQQMAVWVGQKFTVRGGTIAIAAAPGDEEADRPPAVLSADRPLDAPPQAQPNVYAPLRIQEQLVVPVATGTSGLASPLASVTEKVPAGAIFYLEFSAAGIGSPGTAAAIRLAPEPSGVLAQEVPVGPSEWTSSIGPLSPQAAEADYLVVVAGRGAKPLVETLRRAWYEAGPGGTDAEAAKLRIAKALEAAGHAWYGLQRIRVESEAAPPDPAR